VREGACQDAEDAGAPFWLETVSGLLVQGVLLGGVGEGVCPQWEVDHTVAWGRQLEV